MRTWVLQLVLARPALLQQARRVNPALPFAPVSARAQHVADSVYEKVLESFRAHQDVAQLEDEATKIKGEIAATNAENSRLETELANYTDANGTSLIHADQPAADPAVDSAAATLADAASRLAEPPLEKLVAAVVDPSVLEHAAGAAAERVLEQACDDAVMSAVQTSWKISEELTNAQHAGRISELVRGEVRKACIESSEATAQAAAQRAQEQAAAQKPAQIRRAVALAVKDAALAQARVIVVEQMRAIAANASNATNATVPAAAAVTTPAPPLPAANATANETANATANASAPAEPTAAAVGEMIPVAEMPVPELSPPPQGTPMNLTIGNVTIATDPQPAEAFPTPDERVEELIEQERLNSTTAAHVARLTAAHEEVWEQNMRDAIHAELTR